MRYFITGTDTDAGKSIVAAWLCLHFSCTYWKPIQCGTADGTDRSTVERLSGAATLPERYLLQAPQSPHAAAAAEGRYLRATDFVLPPDPRLIVEGAGGALVPLSESETMADLMQHFALPVLVVARGGLGTINHTLLTIEALRQRNLDIAGIVFTGDLLPENPRAIERHGRVSILGHLPTLSHLSQETLRNVMPPDLSTISMNSRRV
jgi:dethiobiotin synthetase